jgi:hypothetical protein
MRNKIAIAGLVLKAQDFTSVRMPTDVMTYPQGCPEKNNTELLIYIREVPGSNLGRETYECD